MAASVKLVMHQTQMACMVPCYSEEEANLLRRSMGDDDNLRMLSEDDLNEVADLEKAFEQPAYGEQE